MVIRGQTGRVFRHRGQSAGTTDYFANIRGANPLSVRLT